MGLLQRVALVSYLVFVDFDGGIDERRREGESEVD